MFLPQMLQSFRLVLGNFVRDRLQNLIIPTHLDVNFCEGTHKQANC